MLACRRRGPLLLLQESEVPRDLGQGHLRHRHEEVRDEHEGLLLRGAGVVVDVRPEEQDGVRHRLEAQRRLQVRESRRLGRVSALEVDAASGGPQEVHLIIIYYYYY